MPATPAWLAAIETVLNRSIAQSMKAAAAATRLNDTSLEVDIQGFLRIRAGIAAGRLALTTGSATEGANGAGAVISGSPLALFELFAGRLENPARRDGRAPVCISGDAEIAAGYRSLLSAARPDWEEELSRLIGDLPARRLSLAAQGALSWARKFGRTAGENLAEYLQEESRDLVSKPELEEFVAGVDELRETADRFEARLERAERRVKDKA